MSSRRDLDEEITVSFRGKTYAVPIHWRTDAEINRKAKVRHGVEGFNDTQSGHIWASHESNRRKTLDHELEHAFADIRLRIWNED